MQRKDGQVDVLHMLGIELSTVLDGTTEMEYRASIELYEKISTRDDIEIIHYHLGTALTFSFTHDGEKYFFKYDSLATPENELFAYNVASRLGIDTVNYDLAVCGPYKGAISKNFKDPTTTYIDAFELLAGAHHDELIKFETEEDPVIREDNIKKYLFNFHSLDGIWDALEVRYKDREDKEKLISSLMQKIVDRYIFDILLGQVDRKPENWLLAEYADGHVDLAPSFDNARIFMKIPSSSTLGITSENVTRQNFYTARFLETDITRFIKLSSKEFRDHLIESLWVLKEQSVTSIMDSIKHSPCHRFDKNLTDKYQKLCAFQLEFLLENLGLKEVPVIKFTDTEGLLVRSNERGHMTTQVVIPEIAVSIITPNQMVHVLNIDGTLDHHPVLYAEALKKIFGTSAEDLENSCIFMRHVIHDANRKYVTVHIPYHITNTMLEQLSSLIATLKRGGYKVFSAIEPFDPVTRKKLPDEFNIYLETADSIEYLQTHPEHIVDYELPFEEKMIHSSNISQQRKL